MIENEKPNNHLKNAGVSNRSVAKDNISDDLYAITELDEISALAALNTSSQGLTEKAVLVNRERYGDNIVTFGKQDSSFKRLIASFVNPFTVILIALAAVSYMTDVYFAPLGEKDPMTVIIILVLVTVSGLLQFIQETRSGNAASRLQEMIKITTAVERYGQEKREIDLDQVVVGDLIHLAAGDMVPADLRILRAKDLFVSQSALTGESEPVEKLGIIVHNSRNLALTDIPNLAFMGTNVVSGAAVGVVAATGNNTVFGRMSQDIVDVSVQTSFEQGVNAVSWVLIRFILAMVPVVLFLNGFTKGNWMEATLFAISVAVGLTPEMLPMIVTASLAKGAVTMSKKKTIVKSLNAIQNIGSVDVLCTDKTGTLTENRVVLEYYLDVHGESSLRVLRHGFLNSYFQTGLKNLIDVAILERTKQRSMSEPTLQGLTTFYHKVDEVPFDFERRRMSVVVEDKNGKTQMVTKGAVEEIMSICSHVEFGGIVDILSEAIKETIAETVGRLNDMGMRVIAVAQKTNPSPIGEFSVQDESDMVLIGYLAFLDPPKETTADAIRGLHDYGVEVKVLTGDNERVTRTICQQVGLPVENLLLGEDIEKMSDLELPEVVETTTVFAKLSPGQKARVVTSLRDNGHSVGFLGDGINDAAAMVASDVGISVNNAVDIARESADVILLEKDLTVLEEGIIEGRKTYGNMIKYIKMTASSNFGNVFSVLIASAFLPFLPMAAIHLVLLNLIYDISCIALPWDNVDEEFLRVPRKWDASSIANFMLWIGPTSSIFDITTFALMYYIIAPAMIGGQFYSQITDAALKSHFIAVFQAGWFVESMWSQTLVIHMIRTPKVPFIQSRASTPVVLLTFTGIIVLTLIPFTSFGAKIGLAPLPNSYFAWLALTVVLYMGLAQWFKNAYVRKYGELL
ncbi:MAG: magnesium-translocating P-type ATPase [Firmicutes bacterium]|nr:magnesium-translocating P-type ATPase [Bacillota bacterium]